MVEVETDQVTLGWICALEIELVAAKQMLDQEYERPKSQAPNDNNSYSLGRIGDHNIVIAVLPCGEYGLTTAGTVAKDLFRSFSNVRVLLMVGIAGGAPTKEHDIRFGDVVISTPAHNIGGVFQYDYGKTIQNQSFFQTGVLNLPPIAIRTAMSDLKAEHMSEGHQINATIDAILSRKPRLREKWRRPPPETDQLFATEYLHVDPKKCCQECCLEHDNIVHREARGENHDNPAIHYGIIASSNQLMKDAITRDRLAKEKGVLCFETEAAGLMNSCPCLVIRGICDYADTHKGKNWQKYAALTAASYTKELIQTLIPSRVVSESKIWQPLPAVKKISDNVDVLFQRSNQQDHKKALEWFSDGETEKHFTDIDQQVICGTGSWFLNHQSYQRWRSGHSKNLICPGFPGAGKTCLTSVVVRDLLHFSQQTEERCTVLFYFCRYSLQQSQNYTSFLRALLAQIVRRDFGLAKVVLDWHQRFEDESTAPTAENVLSALTKAMSSFARVFVLIDALDELEGTTGTRRNVTQTLLTIASRHPGVQFMFTSQPEAPALESIISPLAEDYELIRIEASLQDMEIYLQKRLADMDCLQASPEVLKAQIVSKLIAIADGIFLVAKINCDTLTAKVNEAEVLESLASLKPGAGALQAAFDESVCRMESQPESYRNLARKVILWLKTSRRPLSSTELQTALSYSPELNHFSEGTLMPILRIVSVCNGLVSFQKDNDTILFSHKTIPELFSRRKDTWLQGGQELLGRTCLQYLQVSAVQELDFDEHDPECKQNIRASTRNEVLLNYALVHGGHHLRASKDQELAQQFFSILGNGVTSRLILSEIANLDLKRHPGNANPAFVLAFFGFVDELASALSYHNKHLNASQSIVEQLPVGKLRDSHIERLKKITSVDMAFGYSVHGSKMTIMEFAVLGNQVEVVKLLLGLGASAQPVFNTAIHRGHIKIVKLLLPNISYEALKKDLESILKVAIDKGQQEIIAAMFQHDMITDSMNHDLIEYTALEENPRVLIQLLEHGIFSKKNLRGSLDHQNLKYLSTVTVLRHCIKIASDQAVRKRLHALLLYFAVVNGRDGLVQELLEMDVDILPHHDFKRVWEEAQYRNHMSSAFILFEWHARQKALLSHDVELIFSIAAAHGNHRLAKTLMANFSDDEDSEEMISNALEIACSNGHLILVKMFLQADSHVSRRRLKKSQALSRAIKKGHHCIAEYLLNKGANVRDFRSDENETSALASASKDNYPELVRLLLTRGANACELETDRQDPIMLAVVEGHAQVVKIILESGLYKSAEPGLLGQALYLASQGGDQSIVDLLFEQEVDINFCWKEVTCCQNQDVKWRFHPQYTTLLSVAACYGNLPMTRRLLERDAKMDLTEVHHPLVAAASSMVNAETRLEIVRLIYQQVNLTMEDAEHDLQLRSYPYSQWNKICRCALEEAMQNCDSALVEFFLESGTPISLDTWRVAGKEPDIDVLNVLRKRTKGGYMPLDALRLALPSAACKGRLEVLDHLMTLVSSAKVWNAHATCEFKEVLVKLWLHQALHLAVCANDFQVARALIDHGAPVTTDDISGHGLLLHAARHGSKRMIKVLLRKGAEVNFVATDGRTALTEASHGGRADAVLLLLEAGADVNLTAHGAKSALRVARDNNNNDVSLILLEAGADLNLQSGEDCTTPHTARALGDQELVNQVLCSEANLDKRPERYSTTLQTAVAANEDGRVRSLLQRGADPNAVSSFHDTPLQAAAIRGDLVLMRVLLAAGANVNAQGGLYGCALQAAISYLLHYDGEGSLSTHRIRRPAEHDVNAMLREASSGTSRWSAGNGTVPLEMTQRKKSYDMAEMLLQRGADPNVGGGLYDSALQAAACAGAKSTVKLLLENGAQINHFGGKYSSALHAAVYWNHIKTTKLLLTAGANCNVMASKHGTALDLALEKRHGRIAEILASFGARAVFTSFMDSP